MDQRRDLALLRRFEPIIRYTRGEEFFPIDVARYVEACSLWVKRPYLGEPTCLTPQAKLTLDVLGQPRFDEFSSVFFMKFAEPLTAAELASYKLPTILAHHEAADTFHVGRGRLARVGYISRFAHAIYLLSLLARGRVPGDAAAAALITYRNILTMAEEYHYCGRVVRENGWLVLQYWFFYAFNNWRSNFYGFNDHEADWEMISIYLYETAEGEVTPEWIAYASHDFAGDDLRRRWDDPELEKVGSHPVIYAGAGSHASYYTAGEYLIELELPFVTSMGRMINQFRKFWREKLRQFHEGAEENQPHSVINLFRLPFVDYARGDGLSIGPGQDKEWSPPSLINRPPPWVSQYRGLWGLHIQDPLAGEDAPAGPMYNRDGTVRQAWYDPVGWAGLDKVPPFHLALKRILEQHVTLGVHQARLIEAIKEKSHDLTGLGIEAAAVQNQPHLKAIFESYQAQIKALSAEVDALRAEFAENRAKLEAFELYAQQVRRGERGPARRHLRRAVRPIPPEELQIGRMMETWAALSIGLMLISLVSFLFLTPENWFIGLFAIMAVFIIIEATFRRWLTHLVTQVTLVLATVAALVLLVAYFPQITIFMALIAGTYMLWENLRELWS